MSVTLEQYQAAQRIVREALRDRSYRATPLGLEVARYYRWKKNEWGAAPETLRDYEAILRNLCEHFADLDLQDFAPPVGKERVREAIDHFWGERSARTRAKVRSVYMDFFAWAVRERGLHGNPVHGLARPKIPDTKIETFPPSFVDKVIAAQPYPADWIGTTLILRYGLRRSGLANCRRRDFDFERRLISVKTKGNSIYTLPVIDDSFWRRLGELELEGWQHHEWLIYRQDTRRRRVPIDQATEILDVGRDRIGYAPVVTRRHDVKPTGKLVHFWWYRCLVRAGVVDKGVTAGTNMHRGRHTSATELQRDTHDLRLTQLFLGHKDIRSTAMYAQLDTADLAKALLNLYPNTED